MGAKERRKGQVGEREVAKLIHNWTGWETKRRVRNHNGDSDLLGVPGWSIEVKNCKDIKLALWWKQAVEQCVTGEMPLLVYKRQRGWWRCLWPQQNGNYSFEYTLEGDVSAWAAAAREIING